MKIRSSREQALFKTFVPAPGRSHPSTLSKCRLWLELYTCTRPFRTINEICSKIFRPKPSCPLFTEKVFEHGTTTQPSPQALGPQDLHTDQADRRSPGRSRTSQHTGRQPGGSVAISENPKTRLPLARAEPHKYFLPPSTTPVRPALPGDAGLHMRRDGGRLMIDRHAVTQPTSADVAAGLFQL